MDCNEFQMLSENGEINQSDWKVLELAKKKKWRRCVDIDFAISVEAGEANVHCKVTWHSGISCSWYQSLKMDERDPSDLMLRDLAKNKAWKRFLDVKEQHGIDKKKFLISSIDKQPKEKTNSDNLVKEQEKEYHTVWRIKTGIQQQNRLVDEKNVTLFAKVLHGFEFEVETLGDHRWNLRRMSIKDLVYKKYREENNEDTFAVAVVDNIYSHESLTFNNTVACDVISKWKVGLKDNIDAHLDVYVLNNGCKKCCEDSDGYYREYTPAKGNILHLEIIRNQSCNTLRVSQSRFYNRKLVQTLLEGHSILSLERSLSGTMM
nr:zinc finger, CCHC-type [Tanacetum cinerariifolium]